MPDRKRLLLITNRFHPQLGGAEFNIFMQAQELAKHLEVDVFTPFRDRDPKREQVGKVTIVRGFNLRNARREYPYIKTETLCPEVFFKTLLGGYDVVHCFPALCRNNAMALLAAQTRGIPVFLSNFDLVDYVAQLANGRTIESILQGLSVSDRSAAFLKRFSAIFTISNRETDVFKEVNPNTFLSTVPIVLDEYEAEVDATAFRNRYGIAPGVPLVLCLGRVSRIKGQDVLVKALPMLRKRLPDFHVLIVGRTDYEPQYLKQMQEFLQQNGLDEQVTFTGGIPREDVIAALKSCDVHVLPVRFMNSGAVVVETWAARRPVLHSDMIDPCYVVEGENGYTFRSEDAGELCEKLVQMLQNPAHCDTMGAKGRQLVEEKFLYPHLIQQYLDAYAKFGGVSV